MKEENVMYVKLENWEGILTKRYLLSTQMILLRILKAMKGYHFLRIRELKSKTKLLNNIKEMSQGIKKIEENIPKLTTSRSFVKEKETGKIEVKERVRAVKTKEDRDLEMQLLDIQEKLRALQI